jgi:hypothetical protein
VSKVSFGAAFLALSKEDRRDYSRRLQLRRFKYVRATMANLFGPAAVVLLGDTPGPQRPTDPRYHHTPFYSTKNSSFWINRLLQTSDIPEEPLIWYNTTHANGAPLDAPCVTAYPEAAVIALGANAEKWAKLNGIACQRVHHPQAWKRFHSAEEYPLIPLLKSLCST